MSDILLTQTINYLRSIWLEKLRLEEFSDATEFEGFCKRWFNVDLKQVEATA